MRIIILETKKPVSLDFSETHDTGFDNNQPAQEGEANHVNYNTFGRSKPDILKGRSANVHE